MYIWVVLATFLAILASYTLSPREDIRRLTVEPLAEVYIAKMMTQHKAALDYAKYMRKAGHGFSTGEINYDYITNFFPVGHSLDPKSDFSTRIYCMDKTGATVYTGGCRSGDGGRRALITFSLIPLRWLNTHVNPERPSNDFLNAMKNTIDSGVVFGYMAPTDDTSSKMNMSKSKVLLIDRDNAENYLYKAIADDADFKKSCNTAENKICLVYQSNI